MHLPGHAHQGRILNLQPLLHGVPHHNTGPASQHNLPVAHGGKTKHELTCHIGPNSISLMHRRVPLNPLTLSISLQPARSEVSVR